MSLKVNHAGNLTHDMSTTAIFTTFVTLGSALSPACDSISIDEGAGQTFYLGWSDTNLASTFTTTSAILCPAGGFSNPFPFSQGQKYYMARALDTTMGAGDLVINFYTEAV